MPRVEYVSSQGELLQGTTDITGSYVLPKDRGMSHGLRIWKERLRNEGKNPDDVTRERAGSGTLAHHMMDQYIHHKHPEDELPNAVDLELTATAYDAALISARGSFDMLRDWWDMQTDFEVVCSEISMVDDRYRFGGTPDVVLRHSKIGDLIVDWKTGSSIPQKNYLQCAGYMHLWMDGRKNENQSSKYGEDYVLPSPRVARGFMVVQAHEPKGKFNVRVLHGDDAMVWLSKFRQLAGMRLGVDELPQPQKLELALAAA